MELVEELNQTVMEIVRHSENQLELLIGECESDLVLTNTQEHILMLIHEGIYTSSEIARTLGITQAAVTKAMKVLVREGLVVTSKVASDARVTRYTLSEAALSIALEHQEHHQKTLNSFAEILEQFSPGEKRVIARFLSDLRGVIQS